MATTKFFLLILWIGVVSTPISLFAQSNPVEICDNAVDDDGDGLIDLNDIDCICQTLEPVSLIPNPSFEENNCCPSNRGQMNCASEWIQASEATTDFIHTCGWLGWEGLPVPLPIPDGDGCVGFRDGRFGTARSEPGWKEYTGACLSYPLEAGLSYKFRFFIGFTHSKNSPPIDITFFGSTDCDNLPFGMGDEGFGCPTNGSGWKRLGSVYTSGVNEWKTVEINVTPEEDIKAIAIGPPCRNAISSTSTYYFFDNLILASEDLFNFQIKPTRHLCDPQVRLTIPDIDSASYQWYKEGIALLGETNSTLSKIYGDGVYQVRMQSPVSGCRTTPTFIYETPVYESFDLVNICEGEDFFFNNQSINEPGVFIDSLKTEDGCDSIAIIDLSVFHNKGDSVSVKIFPGELFSLDHYRLYNPGNYTLNLTSKSGCDSTVYLSLEHFKVFPPNAFTPNGDGINDVFTVFGGEELVSIEELTIFNRWGKVVYHQQGLSPNNPDQGWNGRSRGKVMPEGVYVFTAKLKYTDYEVRTTSGSVSLIR